jgi:soluble lytic murein transglycosylase-like protein
MKSFTILPPIGAWCSTDGFGSKLPGKQTQDMQPMKTKEMPQNDKVRPVKRSSSTPAQRTKPIRRARAARSALTFARVKALVEANNKSNFSTELIISICWKESSFDPSAAASTTTATGLMMLTKPAVDDVNKNTPQGTHFEHSEMIDAAKNIQCGTWYLKILFKRWGNNTKKALEHYGTGSGYADDLLQCETCLQSSVVPDPMTCLQQIHG